MIVLSSVLPFCDCRYTELKRTFEINAKELPRDVAKAEVCLELINACLFKSYMSVLIAFLQFESVEFISIPSSLKTKFFRDYEKAASKGDAHAAFMMAVCYRTGFGVELDTKKMLDSCIKAAAAGSLDAMVNLAQSYEITRFARRSVGRISLVSEGCGSWSSESAKASCSLLSYWDWRW